MEEISDERGELPAFLYGHLLRERASLRRLEAKRSEDLKSAIDVSMEPGDKPNRWEMTFRGVNARGNVFRVTLEMRRRGRGSTWLMASPRVFVDDVENENFEGDIEDALAAALGGSGGKVGDTQGLPAVDARGTRSNAVETRRATVIRN